MSLPKGSRRDHEQGGGAGLRKLDFFRFGLFLNSSATDIVLVTAQARQLKQQLRSAQVAGQWRGDTALTPLFVLLLMFLVFIQRGIGCEFICFGIMRVYSAAEKDLIMVS